MEPESSRKKVMIPSNNPFIPVYLPADEFSPGDRSDHMYPSHIGIIDNPMKSDVSKNASGVTADEAGNLKKYFLGF